MERSSDSHTLRAFPSQLDMSESASHSGSCPFCGTQLQSATLLIEYEVGNETRAYLECSNCGEPVNPQ